MAPLAASMLQGRRMIAWGATLSVVALAATALAEAVGAAEARPDGALAVSLGLVGLSTTILGFAAAILLRPSGAAGRRHARARAAPRRPRRRAAESGGRARRRRRGRAGARRLPRAYREPPLRARRHRRRGPRRRRPRSRPRWPRPRAWAALAVAFPLAGPDLVWLQLDLARAEDGRLVGVIRDASADQAREAALETARADAEALNLGKSRFLANMSHELAPRSTPSWASPTSCGSASSGRCRAAMLEYADLIHDAGGHLLDLINDVLDMSKIEAAKYELALEHLDAREPVSAALRLHAAAGGRRRHPAARRSCRSEPLEAEADRRALKQIVLNLVSNALKFTPRGGLVTVSLRAQRRRAGALGRRHGARHRRRRPGAARPAL